jgi:TRAP-type mannitol/chloroaromatic compound transport system substrate-binding protein
MITRRTAVGAVAAAPVLAAGPALAQASQTLRMTTITPETTEIFQGMARPFAARVKELTGGAVDITPYPLGVIAPLPKVYDAVSEGLAELGHAPVPLLANKDPATALFSSFPGGMGTDALLHWMYHGGGYDLLVRHHHETLGLHPLMVGFATTELFAHSHKPVRTLADFKGLKYRSLGIFADILRELGATPVSTPGPEILSALQQRTIDAAEFLSPADNLKLGYNKLARYVIAPGIHLPGGYFTVFMKLDRWNGFAPPVRAAMEQAAREVSLESWLSKGVLDMDAMTEMAKTNEIIRLDDEVIARIKELGRAWATRTAAASAANAWIGRVAEAHFGFQDRWDTWRWTRL